MLKNFGDFQIDLPNGASGEIYTRCPKCSSERKKKTSKCLGVNVEEGVWICHHCAWSGSLKGKTEYQAAHWHKPEWRKPKTTPKADLPAKVIEWFAERGIGEAVLVRNKIGYDSVYMPQVEDFVSAVAFPYHRSGEHINTKWRDGKKNFRMEAGAELILYGTDDIDPTSPLIWVEGEIDKLSLEQAGFTNCVSVPNGAPPADAKNYASKFDWLDLEQFDEMGHILFFDMDEPGRKLELEIARRLGKERCRRVIPPVGIKDANELLVKHDKTAVREAVANAQDFPIDGVKTAELMRNGVLSLHRDGRERGVLTGWPDVDELYTARPGEMTVITGIPNSGKSNWLDSMIINIGKQSGWRFGMFSPENQPVEEHVAALAEKYSGTPFDKGPSARMSADDVNACVDWLNNHVYWLLSDDAAFSLDDILDRGRSMVAKYGINGLIIDPWNEVEHLRPQNMSETEYISSSLGKIRRFARTNNVHVWIVAHPTKLRKQDSGQYEVPTPYDISGSAHWRNKADNCITVYRHFTPKGETPKPVDIHVQKIRFRQVGTLGVAQLDYQWSTSNYTTHVERHYARDA